MFMMNRIKGSLKNGSGKLRIIGLVILLAVFSELFVYSLLYIIFNFFPSLGSMYTDNISGLLEKRLVTFISVTVVSPLMEELIFRGLILKLFHRFLNFAIANVLQALLFGIYHMNLVQGLYAFLLGILIGCIFYLTRNILYCVLFHFVLNTCGVILGYLYIDFGIIVISILMVVTLGLGMYTFMTMRRLCLMHKVYKV